MSDEPARIAAGLTKAQKDALASSQRLMTDASCWIVRSNLIMGGDKWPEGMTQRHNSLCAVLTPLGLAVRAHLQREAGGEE